MNRTIPDSFWPEFEQELRNLAAVYNPVSIARLYPFMVSRLHGNMVETIIGQAQARGLISIDVHKLRKNEKDYEDIRMIKVKL